MDWNWQELGRAPSPWTKLEAELREALGAESLTTNRSASARDAAPFEVDVGSLGRLGCDMGQGWLPGRPLPAEQGMLLTHGDPLVIERDAAQIGLDRGGAGL